MTMKKSTKKFLRSHLSRTIQQRRKNQKVTKQRERSVASAKAAALEQKKMRKSGGHVKRAIEDDGEDDDNEDDEDVKDEEEPKPSSKGKAGKAKSANLNDMSVDEFLNASFLDENNDNNDDDDDEESLQKYLDTISDDDDDGSMDVFEQDAEEATAGLHSNDDDDEDDDAYKSKRGSSKKSKKSKKNTTTNDDNDDETNDADDDVDGDDYDEEAALREIEEHERELRELAEKDPEFYQHLKENDADLLSFSKQSVLGEDGDDEKKAKKAKSKKQTSADDDDDEDADNDDDETAASDDNDDDTATPSKPTSSVTSLTAAQWKTLQHQILHGSSMMTWKRLCRLFSAAVQSINAESDPKNVRGLNSHEKLLFANSKQFNEVIRFTVLHAPVALGKLFNRDLSTPSAPETSERAHGAISSHPNWTKYSRIVRSIIGNLVRFISELVDPQMLRFVLLGTLQMVPLFEPLHKHAFRLLKSLLRIWATSERNVRIDAFLCIRQLAIHMPAKHHLLEDALKGIYLTYVRNSKFCTVQTVPVIEFMANCVVELYSIEPVSAYQHAFVYIRQLAIHLRSALNTKAAATGTHGSRAQKGGAQKGGAHGGAHGGGAKKGSASGARGAHGEGGHKTIYNWQFINCLRVWAKVLSACGLPPAISSSTSAAAAAAAAAAAPMSALRPLIYPFVQICLGVLHLMPTTRYHPLRLHVVSFLNPVAEATHVYVPVLPTLLSVLTSPELKRQPIASTQKVVDVRTVLKVGKPVVGMKAFQEQIVEHAIDAIMRHLVIFSYSVSFPELVLPVQRLLKRFAKTTQIHRVRKQVSQLLVKIEANSAWIVQKRNQTSFAPKDAMTPALDAVASFKPQASEEGAGGEGGASQAKSTSQQSPLVRFLTVQSSAPSPFVADDKADWKGAASASKKGNQDEEGGDGSDDDEGEEQEEDVEMDEEEEDDDDVEMDEDDEDDEPVSKSRRSGSVGGKRARQPEPRQQKQQKQKNAQKKVKTTHRGNGDADDDARGPKDIVKPFDMFDDDE